MAETNEKLKVKRGKSDALPTEVESGSLIFETDTGTAYVDADDERIQIVDPTKLPLTGGTMEGDIDMGDNNITTTHVPEDDADVANKKYVDEHSGGGEGGSYFAVCDSESDVQDKTADCGGFTLTDGVCVNVKFTNTNTAETPTLNINNTGTKQIVFQNKEVATAGLIADTIYTFVYDGTNYNVVSGSLNRVDSVEDDNATFRNIVVIESDESVDDVDVPIGSIILQKAPTGLSKVYWGVCSTLGSTSTKVVSCDGFTLKDGSTIHVYFVNTNTSSSLSLNINGTGELYIYSEGSRITSGTFSGGVTYTFVYHDGYYELISGEYGTQITTLEEQIEQLNNELNSTMQTIQTIYAMTNSDNTAEKLEDGVTVEDGDALLEPSDDDINNNFNDADNENINQSNDD